MDWVKEGFGGLGGLSGSNSRVDMLVHYEDGTETLFDASDPMSIVDPNANKIVQWLKPQAFVTITKVGAVSSWACTGKLKVYLQEDVGTVVIHEWTVMEWSEAGTSWANIGESKLMAEMTITADEIDNILHASGQYENNDKFQLSCYAEVTQFTMSFEDGTTETWTRADISAYRTDWTFLWVVSEIQSIGLTISLEKG